MVQNVGLKTLILRWRCFNPLPSATVQTVLSDAAEGVLSNAAKRSMVWNQAAQLWSKRHCSGYEALLLLSSCLCVQLLSLQYSTRTGYGWSSRQTGSDGAIRPESVLSGTFFIRFPMTLDKHVCMPWTSVAGILQYQGCEFVFSFSTEKSHSVLLALASLYSGPHSSKQRSLRW